MEAREHLVGNVFLFATWVPCLTLRLQVPLLTEPFLHPLITPLVLMACGQHVVPASPSYLHVLSVSSWVLCGKLIRSDLNEFSTVISCCVTIYKSACLNRRRMSKTLL